MSVFCNYANYYFEHGYHITPVHPKTKAPVSNDWTGIFERNETEDHLDTWVEKFADYNIGLPCGKNNGVIAIDFDSKDKNLEDAIVGFLPPSPCIKFGSKGWTKFYRYNPKIRSRKLKRQEGAKKNNVIEILSDGTQTVIPPSIHPNGKSYVWMSDPLDSFSPDELPSLPDDLVEKLEMIIEGNETISGRHCFIFGYFLSIVETATDKESIVKNLLHYDLTHHRNNPYFSDPEYFSGKTPEEACGKVVDRFLKSFVGIKKRKGIHWELGKTDPEGFEYAQYKGFFDKYYASRASVAPHWCYLMEAGVYRDTSGNLSLLSSDIDILPSHASDYGLSMNKVEKHFKRWSKALPIKCEIDFSGWNGFDHIGALLSYVSVKNIKHEYFVELFKEWLAGIFLRLKDNRFQNKMMILEGGQGIGKDTFVYNLFSSIDDYFRNVSLVKDDRENFYVMGGRLVLNISEFDRTSKISSSQLKNLITTPDAFFRTHYDRGPALHKLRCTFVASCNMKDIFRDETGARRFLFFELDKINWDYPKNLSRQILQQAWALAQESYKASDEANAAMAAVLDGYTPEKEEDLVRELWNERLGRLASNEAREFEYGEISDVVSDISKTLNIHVRKTLNLINVLGYRKRGTKGKKLYTYENKIRKVLDFTKVTGR